MARPLRILEPNTVWFVSTRCLDARFLLRPDPQVNSLFGFWLARSAQKYRNIKIYGAIMMSNHLHLLCVDPESDLSAFLSYFLGNFAKAVNAFRHRHGPLFERRFSSEPVLDDEACNARLLYLLLNPVEARLVECHDAWLGPLLWAASGRREQQRYSCFNHASYESARRKAVRVGAKAPAPEAFTEHETLTIDPLPAAGSVSAVRRAAMLTHELRRREFDYAEERGRKHCLGMERVLAVDPESSPERPARRPRPLCHASIAALAAAYRDLVETVRQAYAVASAAFRSGDFTAVFPLYTFPPSGQLVRPA
jgi:REP element-mobilizing transposase RayT